MKSKQFFLIFPLLIATLLCGCWDQQVFEDTSIIIYTAVEEGTTNDTSTLPNQGNSKNSDLKTLLFTFASAATKDDQGTLDLYQAEDTLTSAAMSKANNQSPGTLKDGKLQNILISESLAKQGISQLLSNNRIDDMNRFLPDLVITEDSPSKVLETLVDMDLGDSIFTYLDFLIKNGATEGMCPDTSIQENSLDIITSSLDATCPILGIKEDKVIVNGTAFFKEKTMVGKMDTEESLFFNLLLKSYNNILYTVAVHNQDIETDEVMLYITKSKKKMKVTVDNNINVAFNIDIYGYIDDLVLQDVLHNTTINDFSRLVEQRIKPELDKTVAYTQGIGSDPYYIKEKVRAYHHDFYKSHNMDEAYKNAKITTNVTFHLTNNDNK